MVEIRIVGIKDGVHDIDMEIPVSEVDGLNDEFFGNILLKGKLRKIGHRFSFTGTVSCKAQLTCDLTLNEFAEEIIAEVKASYIADNSLFYMDTDEDVEINEAEEYVIREDATHIDMTRMIAELLVVNIPMKKVSPEARGKDLKEIFPEHSGEKNENTDKTEDDEIDDRWAPLKNIKIN